MRLMLLYYYLTALEISLKVGCLIEEAPIEGVLIEDLEACCLFCVPPFDLDLLAELACLF